MVIDRSKCIPSVDFNPDEVYCGNVTATFIKIFFALSALYGLILLGGDLVGAYLVTPGSKEFMLCIATPPGIIAPKGMILQVLGNLYGLPSSGRNFSKAVDLIVAKCGYKSTCCPVTKWYGDVSIFELLLKFKSWVALNIAQHHLFPLK